MPKLTEEQLEYLKVLPYFSKLQDLIPLYELGILTQEKFNDEILKLRENFKPQPGNYITPSGIEMVLVEGGTFEMGSNERENGLVNEKPVHSVTISDFYIGKTEVTQAQWKAVMGTNPSYFKGDDLPVEQVSWYDAVEFCKRLSQKEGVTYRLPTEAEWEYAAKGGNASMGYKYSGSDDPDAVAWYRSNFESKTHTVATKKPNELGIYDMSGNVWEWCSDWYGDYPSGTQIDPKGPSSGLGRVLRGGSWFSINDFIRCAYRGSPYPNSVNNDFGFRLSRTK
ncbi:MAG TPA: formylglycine-generating enzyme family protein [Clostridiales bacterium]|nr:formylglycine-generating enzyme family protein [Clostridiales bacterium]HQP70469.1 formylglycine-generating enzyme family protein [Clostridiales bacterium]